MSLDSPVLETLLIVNFKGVVCPFKNNNVSCSCGKVAEFFIDGEGRGSEKEYKGI